jgi:hypothetical protein
MIHRWTEPEEATIAAAGIFAFLFPGLREALVAAAAMQLNLPSSKVRWAVRAALTVLTGAAGFPRASKRLVRLIDGFLSAAVVA